jgi:hypothetical protein
MSGHHHRTRNAQQRFKRPPPPDQPQQFTSGVSPLKDSPVDRNKMHCSFQLFTRSSAHALRLCILQRQQPGDTFTIEAL